jgi:AcrR family transcriptional regulator
LLDAALALIEREGADAPTLRGVAKLAGVSQAAPYRHFRNKDALLAAVAEEGFRAIEFATRHPAHFRVMFGRVPVDRSAHPSLLAAAQETFGLLLGTIRECQAAGVVRTGDPDDLALCAWSAVHGLSALAVDGRLGERARRLESLVQTVNGNIVLGLEPR